MIPNKGDRKYAMNDKNSKGVYLQIITMIDQTTIWIEIHCVSEARADLVTN